jgi:hypothetical protein
MLHDELSCSILWQGDPLIPSAVKKCLVNFRVSCVRRSRLCCFGIHGWVSRAC